MPTAPKNARARKSRRVSWPEPGRADGGEFRLTTKRLAGIIGLLVMLVGAVPTYWTISDHWMNRQETLKAMKDHADHDAAAQAWTTYGFAQNRVDYLEDKLAECELHKATHAKMDPVEAGICARYEAKYRTKTDEANQLKARALESAKEKALLQ